MNFIYSIGESCDELPTSLVYLDTSEKPCKLLGHVQIKEFYQKKDLLEFKNGTDFINGSLFLSNIKNTSF